MTDPEPATLAEAIDLAVEAARVLVKAQRTGMSDDFIADMRRYSIEAERRVGELAS